MLQLRDYQIDANKKLAKAVDSGKKRILYSMATGGGKCLGRGTPILMYNGTIKNVEDIVVGDILMSPKSAPVRVKSLASGSEMLYKVTQVKGDSYIVNESHILSLRLTNTGRRKLYVGEHLYSKGDICNVSIKEYMASSKTFKHCAKGWKPDYIKFPQKILNNNLPPYILGVWLGDGTSRKPEFTSADAEIVLELEKYAKSIDGKISSRVQPNNKSKVYYISNTELRSNKLLHALKSYNLLQNKHIPLEFKTTSRHNRLELLAGLIDSDGHMHHNGYDLVFKNEILANDTAFLARSLGFAAHVKKCKKKCYNTGAIDDYFRIYISGEVSQIPCRLKRKRASVRLQKKNVLNTGISIEKIGVGEYFGFELDDDEHLFMLGDFTVTHNTACFSDFVKKTAKLGYKSLIIVDRLKLLKQTLRWSTKEVPFGVLTSEVFKPKNITVAMLQTLRARLKSETYQTWVEQFDICFFDEVHQFCEGTAYRTICDLTKNDCSTIGVTATPWDMKGFLLDGFDEFINGADIRTLIEKGYLVKPNHLTIDLFDFSNVKITKKGEYDSGAIDDIVVDTDKIDKVFDLWNKHARYKKTIAFCSTVKSAEHYARFFGMQGIKAQVVSEVNTEEERDKFLIDFENGEIEILFNVALYIAGLDVPSIECVMFLNPTKIKRRYIQCAGRGLRLCPEIGKTECLFLDFVGNSFRHLEVDAIQSYIPAPKKTTVEEFDEIECPACGFVFNISEKECPECGFILDFKTDEGGGGGKPKNKKDFEKLIKLKSVQSELHDIIYEFAGLPCLVKIEDTGITKNGKPIRKWCYGYRDDGSPIFKTDKDYSQLEYPYPLVTNAKKTNCWYVFHTICIKYNPSMSALRYYGKKLRKAKAFLEQIKNPNNKAFVNLYRLME